VFEALLPPRTRMLTLTFPLLVLAAAAAVVVVVVVG
jgi:hypothetical protein